MTTETLAGCRVQQLCGQTWVTLDAGNRYSLPPVIADEIRDEILEGGIEECEEYLASNGQAYRWS
jgi:hypothetical protein